MYRTMTPCFLPLDLMAAPTNGQMEQLTTPLRVPKPFDEMHNEDLPKAIVSPMVHVAETTGSAGKAGSVDLILFSCYRLRIV